MFYWNIYSNKVKSGRLEDLLEIISNLTVLKTIHNLNSMEKMILRNTKKILIDEIAQSKRISIDEATYILDLSMSSWKLYRIFLYIWRY